MLLLRAAWHCMTVMTWLYFVKDAGKVDFVAQNEGIILETLQKYADSCVKRVSAYAAKLRTNAE